MSKELKSVDRRINQELWPQLMIQVVQPVYSKLKQDKKQCLQFKYPNEYHECIKKFDEEAISLNLSMEYFNNKYNTCIEEGRQMGYKQKDVKRFCKEKIFKAAKGI